MAAGSPDPVTAAGQVLTYQFAVTNTGDTTQSLVGVTDTQTPPAGPLTTPPACQSLSSPAATCSGATTTLAPGQTALFTATYTVTQNDLDNGSIGDSAIASGTPLGTTTPISSPPATFTVAVTQTASISLVKTVTSNAPLTTPGQVVTYDFAVTNTGNVTLSDLTVADTQEPPAGPLTSEPTCPQTSLTPAQTETCTGSYTITQADIDQGTVNDTATASGTTPAGAILSATSNATAPTQQTAAITLVKTAATPAGPITGPDQTVNYDFVVTNTGNVDLAGITVDDTQTAPAGPLTSGPTCPQPTLAPGDSETCTGTYISTQADIDHGAINDTAAAAGSPPTGPAVTADALASVPVTQTPALSVAKSVASPTTPLTTPGQTVTYDFAVTNTGNVTLTDLTVDDTQTAPAGTLTSGPTCAPATLAPGDSETCTGTYVSTQADIDHGAINDTATASGDPPIGPAVTSPSSTASVPVTQTPALTVAKSASPDEVTSAGEIVHYSYQVTNTGNVTLTDVIVTDNPAPPAGPLTSGPDCPDSTLAPNQAQICAATYTVTAADLAHGSIADTAVASGDPPIGTAVDSAPSQATVAVSAISMVKSASPASIAKAGDVITYRYLVTNSGDYQLTGLHITDTQSPPAGPLTTGPTCPVTTLPSGEHTTCTATYTVTQADIDHGSVHDSAVATATDPNGGTVTSPPSTASVPATQTPHITVTKAATPTTISQAGQVIDYHYLVTNAGNVTLTDVHVTDTQSAAGRPAHLRSRLPPPHARARPDPNLHWHLHRHPSRPHQRQNQRHGGGQRRPTRIHPPSPSPLPPIASWSTSPPNTSSCTAKTSSSSTPPLASAPSAIPPPLDNSSSPSSKPAPTAATARSSSSPPPIPRPSQTGTDQETPSLPSTDPSEPTASSAPPAPTSPTAAYGSPSPTWLSYETCQPAAPSASPTHRTASHGPDTRAGTRATGGTHQPYLHSDSSEPIRPPPDHRSPHRTSRHPSTAPI